MQTSTILQAMLSQLSVEARRRGLNDTQWCQAAGVRKETLSRLRKRTDCDLGTLAALAAAVGARVGVTPGSMVAVGEDVHFPAQVGREYEERLLDLLASAVYDPRAWQVAGPAFFMAGLAVMAASVAGLDRRRLLATAEALHPGSSQPDVFALWLQRSPVRPSRFLPLLEQRFRRAA